MQKKALLVACFFICTGCFAQQYPFVHYTPRDGLVNCRVRKAYQDSKGRMYFSTFGGLSVYDGARFKNYTTQNGLLSDLVNDVVEVGDDSLLVAINTCGLNVLVRGKMKTLNTGKNNCPILNHFLKSKDGNVYASADDGLYRINKNGFEKLSVVIPEQARPVIYLGDLAEYGDYIVFTTNDLGNYAGLFLYSKKKDTITDVLRQVTIQGLASDHRNIIWVGTTDGMHNLDTAVLDAGKLALRQPYIALPRHESFITGNIKFNLENEPLIASDMLGIIHYNKDGSSSVISSSELPNKLMTNFFVDREDVLWICHDGNGVYKLSNTKLQSTGLFIPGDQSGVNNAKAFSQNIAWIVMNDRKWVLHTPAKNKIFTITPDMDLSPIQYDKTYLYAGQLNNLYIAPLPKNNESVISFKKNMTLPDTANFGAFSVIDPSGNIILFENRNICVLQDAKQIATYPLNATDLAQGMYIDKKKMLWVINRSGGLMIFSLHPDDPIHYLQKEFQFVKEFGNASPRCMTVDKNETLWVGTRYDGLMAFEYKNNQLIKLRQFQTQNGLTDNFVTTLACDENDNIIIGTQTGMDRLVKEKETGYRLENITKSNNIFAYIRYIWTDVNNAAFALTNAGTIYRLEPVLPPKAIAQPQLIVEEMKVNGNPVSMNLSPVKLKYYQRNISFSVAAPTFIDEGQVQYSYSLSGSGNSEWSDTSSVADINLLNLSPGNYELQVKAFFPSTSYSSREIKFPFRILPPWWQTWWFRIAFVFFLAAISITGVRTYYRRKLEKQRILLEKQQAIEKERTRIATDMHDDLGAGLSRIKFLSETIGIKKQKQQPIEEDITKIREYSHEMIDKMGEIVWALNERNDSLSDLLSYTRSYAVEYLAQNGIACTVSLPEQLPSSFVSGEFRRNIFLAAKEILHNVVKHAQADHVTITMRVNHTLFIGIKDNGTGFDRANIRPYSNGLINIEKRMKDMGGTMNIQSKNGTAVNLEVPLSP
ncbi:MAG: histidine kinase [Bacteroidota bacterium]|nr:histidine kinase [Bacteroidota bacterium]